MKPKQPVKFDYAQSNWRQSIAVKIASQITWMLIPTAFIASIFVFSAMDKYIIQNFEYKVDSLTYRITSALSNNAQLDAVEKDIIISKIANELGFNAVKVVSTDYKLIPKIDTAMYEATTRTIEIGFGDVFENEFISITGYHMPVDSILKANHKNILAVTFLCLTVLAVFLVFSIRQRIYNPLKMLVNATEAATNGEKNIKLDTSRKDEFGHLAVFFQQMLVKLNQQHERLKETAEDAEQANKAKSVFLANMSHELRTPLNAIIGYGELILEDNNILSDTEHNRDMRKIVSAGHHLLNLINEILDLSKIEAGKLEVLPVDIDLPHMLDELSTTITPLAEQNSNKLIISCSPQVRQIYSDNLKVRQILINLLGNACKFTENGVISLNAEPKSVNSIEYVMFTVADTGTGISEDLIDNLFEPFTQGDDSTTKNHGGTGLGLSICHRLSILLGGDITVSSTVGEGTTFVVTIPLRYSNESIDQSTFEESSANLRVNQRK